MQPWDWIIGLAGGRRGDVIQYWMAIAELGCENWCRRALIEPLKHTNAADWEASSKAIPNRKSVKALHDESRGTSTLQSWRKAFQRSPSDPSEMRTESQRPSGEFLIPLAIILDRSSLG